jgi:hypothetical protein
MPTIKHSNTTIYNGGGICNHIIRNICSSEIAKKYNLKFSYIVYDEMIELGLEPFIDGKLFYDSFIEFDEGMFEKHITKEISSLTTNIHVGPYYFQNPFTAKYLRNYFLTDDVRTSIINNNKFKERYNNNNDLCIHVRLGDGSRFNPGFEYYDRMIQKQLPTYEHGYIVSDEINNPICQQLIEKYQLEIFNGNAIETLMFGSTCKYILLSSGTFSWMMGIMGFNSDVFFPDLEKREKWHGDIFVFNDWIKEI